MLTWMLYVIAITVVLSGAALAAEHAARFAKGAQPLDLGFDRRGIAGHSDCDRLTYCSDP